MTNSKQQLGSRGHSLAAHVEEILRTRIRDGVFAPGSLLPSRRTLCADLGIAPTTLEKAVKTLLADGTLRAEPRRGTFVADTVSPCTLATSPIVFRHASRSRPRRIGILSVDNDLAALDPNQSLFDYMVLHSAEDRVSSLGGELIYRAPQPRQFDPGYLTEGAAEEFLSLGADAVIFIAVHVRVEAVEREIAIAAKRGLPAVVISSSAREWKTTHVWTDNRMAGRIAAEHLIESGHSRIGVLAPFDAPWQEDRIEGARDSLRQTGLDESRLQVLRLPMPIGDELPDHPQAIAAGAELAAQARQLIADGCTGIMAVNDWVAIGALKVLSQTAIEPGEDYGLVSFDDQAAARQNGISSFRFPLETLGLEAATLAMRAANGESLLHRLRIVGRVVARQSTRRLREPQAASA